MHGGILQGKQTRAGIVSGKNGEGQRELRLRVVYSSYSVDVNVSNSLFTWVDRESHQYCDCRGRYTGKYRAERR